MTGRQTPLYETHEDAGATFTDFGGWDMPVEFEGIRTEHTAVRESIGKFDVSHMGEIVVSGSDAVALTQRLTTNDVTALEPGDAQYAAITRSDGVMLDDTVVYRLPEEREGDILFIPNAGHDEQMAERWRTTAAERDLAVSVDNRTQAYGMLAVQGPDAPDEIGRVSGVDLNRLSRFEVVDATIDTVHCLVAKTGYTGEPGAEIICPWEETVRVWETLEAEPIGLGARDTLRLEMGFLLSGQDFHPETEPRTPYEAGIGFTVKLDTEFVGRDALEGINTEGPAEELVGLTLIDRGIPRAGYEITAPDGESLGTVTSGTMSPTLGEPIALGYVPAAWSDPGTIVRVTVRGEPKKARIRTTPFLDE